MACHVGTTTTTTTTYYSTPKAMMSTTTTMTTSTTTKYYRLDYHHPQSSIDRDSRWGDRICHSLLSDDFLDAARVFD